MRIARVMLGLVLLGAAGFGGFVFTGDMLAATAPEPAGVAQSRQRGGATVVTVTPITTMLLAETVDAVGTTRARQSVTLHPAASGRIAEIAFGPGDVLREGDVVLRLEDGAARAGLASAEATRAEAQAAYDRQLRLEQSGSAAEATLQAARAALLRAEADRDMAQIALDDRELRAPYGGVVGFTELAHGQLVDSTTEVTTLDDLTLVEVAFSVPERFLAQLARGQAVSLSSPAYPGETFTGRLSAIDTRIDASSRSIALRAEVPNEDRRLAPGMFLRVSLVLAERRAPMVPEAALTVSGAQSYIHIVEAGRARRLEVRTGAQQGGLIEVAGGLPSGAEVILSNLHGLSDGAEVEIGQSAAAALPDEAQG